MTRLKKIGGLGFRDLGSFNKTMLAKQGWRLPLYDDSLVARVLKARYFHRCSFLEADLGSNPLYIWGSMIWGRELLIAGLRWSVGCERIVGIYTSNWLPRPITFRPISAPTLPTDSVVADSILDGNCWSIPMLRQQFLDVDVQ